MDPKRPKRTETREAQQVEIAPQRVTCFFSDNVGVPLSDDQSSVPKRQPEERYSKGEQAEQKLRKLKKNQGDPKQKPLQSFSNKINQINEDLENSISSEKK